MSFELINNLSESVAFRSREDLNKMDLNSLSQLFYLYHLALVVLSKDPVTKSWAQRHASKSKAFPTFEYFRLTSTDYYLAAFVLTGGFEEYHDQAKILKNHKVSSSDIRSFLEHVVSGCNDLTWMQGFFFRLESKLKITSGMFKDLRRSVIEWDGLNKDQKEDLVKDIFYKIRLLQRRSEILDQMRYLSIGC